MADSEIITRFCSSDDYEDILSIIQSQTLELGTVFDPRANDLFLKMLKLHYLDPNKPEKLIGSFVNNQLVAFIGICPWQNLPYATLSDIKSLKGHPSTMSAMIKCINFFHDYALQKNFFSIYYLSSPAYMKKFNSLWKHSNCKFNNGLLFIESKIPANTKPQFAYEWTHMGEMTWPIDLYLFCRKFNNPVVAQLGKTL